MKLFGLEIETSSESIPVSKRSADVMFGENYWKDYAEGVNGMTGSKGPTRSSAVYSCIRLLAETVGSLPLILYRRLPNGGQERAVDHPLYWVLNARPNKTNTRMEFIETMMWHLLLRGNAYCQIKYTRKNIELKVLNPDKVRVVSLNDGTLQYIYQDGSKKSVFSYHDIVHVRAHSDDGVLGKSPIEVARDTVYRAISMEEFHTKTYQNGTRLSGILEAKETLDDEVANRIVKSFREAYSGTANAGKVALLEDDVTFKPITMTLEQAEFIDGRKLTRSEIAGLFGVPPHMIGDLDRATFSNIEQQSIAFLTYTIRTWLIRIEQAFERCLFADEQEIQELSIEFLADALLRGDTASRANANKMALESGAMTFNEARQMDNRNPLPWGDATMVPMNYTPISSVEDLKNAGLAKTNTPTKEATKP